MRVFDMRQTISNTDALSKVRAVNLTYEVARRIQHQPETPVTHTDVYIINVQKQLATPKPSGFRGLLIKLSDWLVSLCVSVKKGVVK